MRKQQLKFAWLMVIALCAFTTAVFAKPGSANGTSGLYTIVFAGAYTGEGFAVVNNSGVVVIQGKITEVATGAKGTFHVRNLNTDDGHFTGTPTVLGVLGGKLCGRVEPADGKLILTPRIICTFTTAAGAGARICGDIKP